MSQIKNSSVRRSLWLLFALTLLLAGCGKRPIYSHFEHIGRDGWTQTDTLHFTIATVSAGIPSVQLSLRTSSHYPYTQLSIIARQETAISRQQRTDTLTFCINDDAAGSSKHGVSARQHDMFIPSLAVADADTLRINLYHGMSRFTLPGILDAGITLEDSSPRQYEGK